MGFLTKKNRGISREDHGDFFGIYMDFNGDSNGGLSNKSIGISPTKMMRRSHGEFHAVILFAILMI